eukprot:5854780-Pleurochrysis_carterae.AAC.2
MANVGTRDIELWHQLTCVLTGAHKRVFNSCIRVTTRYTLKASHELCLGTSMSTKTRRSLDCSA